MIRYVITPAELVEILVKHGKWRRGEADGARANLDGANLDGANLDGANLDGANLDGANLVGANLARANLARANLAGAYLVGANLVGAYLARARNVPTIQGTPVAETAQSARPRKTREEWEGQRATSAAERAKRYREHHPEVPVVEALDAKILEAIGAGGQLQMGNWHTCETTHCRAGWAIHLAGKAGYDLERQFDPERAGEMIYRASTGRVPNFYATDESALRDIKACATASDEGLE